MSARRHALRASLLAGFAVSLLLLWLALRQVDLHELARTFAAVQLLPLLLSAAAVATSMGLRALRWRWIAGRPACHHRHFARATYLGLLVNQLAPGRLGELVRVVTLARLSGSTLAGPLASAVLDRLVALVALTILGADYLIITALFLALAIPLTPLAPLLVLFCLAASSALPSAPGYVGVYQAAAVVALAFFAQPAEQGVALATLLQLVTLTVAILMNGRGAWALVRQARTTVPP